MATNLAPAAMLALSSAVSSPDTNLWLIPHTHADVGWLQTPESLARINVSRILDGVVGNLANDTLKQRRFVWDEMYFLDFWWHHSATKEQKAQFTGFVKDGRIELVDNGWSQHDMGCTTIDSMLNNWVSGHQWIVDKFGASARPRVGWSLDPFGISATQTVLQALSGLDAYFFTRLPGAMVDGMKKDRSLEFVWRASSSLGAEESQSFAHVFESYYCMPLPTFAFEWGPSHGAVMLTQANIEKQAKALANIAKQRQVWFRTTNVMIPWGCDYQFQNADLVYNSTDWLIATINQHPEWGVSSRYGTPSEYLAAIKASKVPLPVKAPASGDPGTGGNLTGMKAGHFFPYIPSEPAWSGYFTSRPRLKGLSQQAHGPLAAAETLYATSSTGVASQWAALETARHGAGIVQHHDAITGTPCSSAEGSACNSQVSGGHDVLKVYENYVENARDLAGTVVAEIIGEKHSPPQNLTFDVRELGNLLLSGEKGLLHVYNSGGTLRTDTVIVPVPVCAVAVSSAMTGAAVQSQVTASIYIHDGTDPFYDFELEFEVTLPAGGHASFVLDPTIDGSCSGSDLARATSHSLLWSRRGADASIHSTSGMIDSVLMEAASFYRTPNFAEDSGYHHNHTLISASAKSMDNQIRPAGWYALSENDALEHAITTCVIKTGNSPITFLTPFSEPFWTKKTKGHEVCRFAGGGKCIKVVDWQCKEWPCMATVEQSRAALCTGGAVEPSPIKRWSAQIDNKFITAYFGTSGLEAVFDKSMGRNITISATLVQYQVTETQAYSFSPAGNATAVADGSYIAASVAHGPVMHEIRLQVSAEHHLRFRLFQTEDPALGSRIEVATRVGVLRPMTELAVRFEVPALATAGQRLYSEDNGYETVQHRYPSAYPNDIPPAKFPAVIAENFYPSQVSAFIADEAMQLSVALERSHGVASLLPGTLEVMLQRRHEPYYPGQPTIVLDDTDRLLVETWLAVGNRSHSNRLRHAMKARLNHKFTVVSGPAPASLSQHATDEEHFLKEVSGADLPMGVELQSLRALTADAKIVLARFRHIFSVNEDIELSKPVKFNVTSVLMVILGAAPTKIEEVSLTGVVSIEVLNAERNKWLVENDSGDTIDSAKQIANRLTADGEIVIKPFEFRTFKITKA